MAYRVILTPAVERQLDPVRGAALFALRGVILALSDEPRPPGAVRVTGRRNLWRVRVRIDGQPWRVVFVLDDRDKTVLVTRVTRRDEGTYRGL
jgi:mRNA-degrading endonuclease RelE of RelBE toxin-antitoxin system